MSHSIEIIWELGDQELSPGNYLTDHKVILNENLTIDGGSSPDYGGSVANINPAQNLAAAVSSCFMMPKSLPSVGVIRSTISISFPASVP